MPADWMCEAFGTAMPISMYDRYWLIMSLAELGRFDRAAECEVEAIQLAQCDDLAQKGEESCVETSD